MTTIGRRRTLSLATLLAVAGSWSAGAQAPGPSTGSLTDLGRLTVPASALPATCQPRPPGGMFDANPALVTDPRLLAFMHLLVFGTDSADGGAGRARPSDAQRLGAEELASRAAEVEAGYAAAYEEQGGSPEIGVFALRMKKMPVADGTSAGRPTSARIIRGPVAIFYWSDAGADTPDRGCLDAVRRHIESVDFR